MGRTQITLAGKSDDRIIAQGGDGLQRHAASALDRSFVVLLELYGADEH